MVRREARSEDFDVDPSARVQVGRYGYDDDRHEFGEEDHHGADAADPVHPGRWRGRA
jgi:hypothetical protein